MGETGKMADELKILLGDIEIVQKTLGDAWRTMGANHSFLNCFGYKWHNKKSTHRIDLNTTKTLNKLGPFNNNSDEAVVRETHIVMSQADILVGHYGNKFDWKYMNAKFDKYGLPHLTHIPKFDTCLMARQKYKLGSNRLDSLCEFFGVTRKQDIDHKHWMNLYTHDARSMRTIGVYCEQDVLCLEQVFNRMKHHFNIPYHSGVAEGNPRSSCPQCGFIETAVKNIRTTKSGLWRASMFCADCNHCWTIPKSVLVSEGRIDP